MLHKAVRVENTRLPSGVFAKLDSLARSRSKPSEELEVLHRHPETGVVVEGRLRRKLHAFDMRDEMPFGMAAIWANWLNPTTGWWERSFAIVTVEANSLVAQVRDRPPVIFGREDCARLLGTDPDPRELVRPNSPELIMMSCGRAFIGA